MNPILSIILNHHLPENREYLDLAIKGVLSSTFTDFELLIGCSYKIENLPEDPRIRLIQGDDLSNATKKIYAGVEQMHPDSQSIMFLSDDVFISKYLLEEQMKILSQVDVILNPFSNGEIGSRFFTDRTLTNDIIGGEPFVLRPDINIEDIKNYEESASFFWRETFLILTDWVSYYATIMSKKTYKLVGPLDPNLDVRHNDQDHCLRAKALGIPSIINLGAFCIHFGTKTLNKCYSKEEMNQATIAFQNKLNHVST